LIVWNDIIFIKILLCKGLCDLPNIYVCVYKNLIGNTDIIWRNCYVQQIFISCSHIKCILQSVKISVVAAFSQQFYSLKTIVTSKFSPFYIRLQSCKFFDKIISIRTKCCHCFYHASHENFHDWLGFVMTLPIFFMTHTPIYSNLKLWLVMLAREVMDYSKYTKYCVKM